MLKIIFYSFIVRPLLVIILGFNARHLDRLKPKGAHVIAANHNSHLDAMVLMSLFKLKDLKNIKVVAAKDYFCRNRISTWFSVNVIGIIPIDRSGATSNPIQPIMDALDKNYTVIIFPEGSRGAPEKRVALKYGITKILESKPNVQITPVYMFGLGKSLPKGEAVLVPFICDINIGKPLKWMNDRTLLINALESSFNDLENEISVKPWR